MNNTLTKIKTWLTNLLKEDNGTDYCIAKVLTLVSFIAVVIYALWGLRAGHFALLEFAQSLGLTVGAGGLSIAAKNGTTK